MQSYEELLKKRDFDGAIEALNSDLTIETPIKYFNLGYIYRQADKLPFARYYFEKAQLSGLINKKTQVAIKDTQEALSISLIESNYKNLDKFILSSHGFSEDTYLSFSLIFLVFSLIAFIKAKKIIGTFCVFTFIILGSFFIYLGTLSSVIVMKEAYVHNGPSRIFEPHQKLLPGMKIIVGKKSKDWIFIDYPQDYKGWIYKAEVKQL